MSLIESVNSTSKSATKISKKYVKASYDYAYLKAFYLTTLSISNIVKIVLIGGVFTMGFVFLLVALAIYLGDILNSTILGLGAVAGITFLLAFITFLFKKQIDKQIIKVFNKKFFKI